MELKTVKSHLSPSQCSCICSGVQFTAELSLRKCVRVHLCVHADRRTITYLRRWTLYIVDLWNLKKPLALLLSHLNKSACTVVSPRNSQMESAQY